MTAEVERAISLLNYYGERLNCKAEFDLAIKALEIVDNSDKLDGDLISRSALKEAVKGNGTVLTTEHIKYLIDNAPTVERPQGEWIKYIRCIECSVCKNKFFADDENENCQDYEPCTDLRFNFCPNCGADMRGKENE